MDVRDNVIYKSTYFFEVLVAKFLELEKSISKQSGILSIFKKISYMDRANAFKELMESAVEAEESLPSSETTKSDYDLYTLACKLTECLALYINMTDAQVNLNTGLNQKANGEIYDLSEHTKRLKYSDMLRDALEAELPKLNALYTRMLTKQSENRTTQANREVDERQLVNTVIAEYIREVKSSLNHVTDFLHRNFETADLEPDNWIEYDLFLFCLSFDSMALFNLLDKQQANRLYNLTCVQWLSKLGDEIQEEYDKAEIAEYKRLYEESVKKSEPPFDYMLSKLFSNFLRENSIKYNIGPMHMMQMMTMVIPMFTGTWKKTLEEFNVI